MKFNEEFGILITDDVRQTIERAIRIAGGQASLGRMTKISQAAICFWMGSGTRQGQIITWDKWVLFRNFLVRHKLIDMTDTRWLMPSELRDAIKTMNNTNDDENAILVAFRQLNERGKRRLLRDAASYVMDEDFGSFGKKSDSSTA